MAKNGERAHSKFSASGAERWFECPGSVELSEGLPDKSSKWAEEGTHAHSVLESLLEMAIGGMDLHGLLIDGKSVPAEMMAYGKKARDFILNIWRSLPDSDLVIESRVYLDFIDKDAFGTLDSSIIDYFGTLHIFDYKYGAGVSVSPIKNLQMIFYALAMAHKHHWNFKRVRIWIIQPRVKGYDGPLFWDISIEELRAYVPQFKAAIKRVYERPEEYVEGSWCHWCKAKTVCPLKREGKIEKAKNVFLSNPITGVNYGEEKESIEKEENEVVLKSEADWKKEERRKKAESKKSRKAKKEKGESEDIGDFY